MAVAAFSGDWAKLFKDEVNKSSVYKSAGKGWKWTVGLVVEAEPDKKFPDARGVVARLTERGVLGDTIGPRRARYVTHADVTDEDLDYVAEVLTSGA